MLFVRVCTAPLNEDSVLCSTFAQLIIPRMTSRFVLIGAACLFLLITQHSRVALDLPSAAWCDWHAAGLAATAHQVSEVHYRCWGGHLRPHPRSPRQPSWQRVERLIQMTFVKKRSYRLCESAYNAHLAVTSARVTYLRVQTPCSSFHSKTFAPFLPGCWNTFSIPMRCHFPSCLLRLAAKRATCFSCRRTKNASRVSGRSWGRLRRQRACWVLRSTHASGNRQRLFRTPSDWRARVLYGSQQGTRGGWRAQILGTRHNHPRV